MDSVTLGHRITLRKNQPNPLFQKWLEHLYNEAKSNGSRLEPMLKEALTSLSKYPLTLQTGSDCAILKGFNKNICSLLDRYLILYKTNGLETEFGQINRPSNGSSNDDTVVVADHESNDLHLTNLDRKGNESENLSEHSLSPKNLTNNNKVSKQNKSKSYIPTFQSGGYAILMALLEHTRCRSDKSQSPLKKDQLIEMAQKYSEESFVRPKPNTFYTAWSNMSRLINKGLVKKSIAKNHSFSLTKEGLAVAIKLFNETKNRLPTNDIIFNSKPDDVNNIIDSKKDESNKDIEMEENIQSCITLSAGSFEIILLIDKNETSGLTKKNDPTVAQFNKYPDLKHEYRSLKVGDYTWIARSKNNKEVELVLPYVVERKRMDDLGASIKDGRFHEQKFRLKRCGLDNIIYMVENFGKNKHVGLPIQSLMQALANTRVQDEFKVHVTESLTDSARFLAMMTKRLTIEYKNKNLKGQDVDNLDAKVEGLKTFRCFNKLSSKNKPLSVTEIFIKLLLQIKGISVEKALAIANTYPTPSSLIKALKETEEGEMLLAHIKYGNSNRNIGPFVSTTMYKFFTSKNLV